MAELPVFVVFYAGALGAALGGRRLRQGLLVGVPVLGLGLLLGTGEGVAWRLVWLGQYLVPYRVDGLSLVFGYLFCVAALLGGIFALHLRDRLQPAAALAYAGSALGAVFAGDLLTLFLFWEALAVSSALLVLAGGTERASRAALRYLVIQVTSGVLLLAGALVQAAVTGSLAFEHLGLQAPGGGLILLAFGIKAAFPLLHNWLTDAYPEASPVGTVFLSAFTTKVAVYALARGFAGTEALVYVGAVMTCFPIFYAVIENDLRRVLAYSMVNQIGFMVAGVGLGTPLALAGAVAHACNDVIFKGLLMMSMGAVLHVTGNVNASDIGGLYKRMPRTAALCLVGAASISAFPLFSGFVSKSLVMAAAQQEGFQWVWLALLFASAGVFHHAGIKVPFFAFFHQDSHYIHSAYEPPGNMLAAMTGAAILCVAAGVFPGALYALLPMAVDYVPYTVGHVLAQLQLLFFSALAFVWLRRAGLYPPELHGVNLDAEWAYRRALPALTVGVRGGWADAIGYLRARLGRRTRRFLVWMFRHHGPRGTLARTWPTGSLVLWVAVLLAVYLALYYR